MKKIDSIYSKNNFNKIKRDSFAKGHTLLELIVSIAIMGVVIAWIGMILIQVVENFNIIENRQDNAMQGKITMDWMVNDIREIAVSGTNLSLATAGLNQISFTNVSGEDIDYVFTSSAILRNSNTLCENVSDLSFTYLDSANSQIAVPVVDLNAVHHIIVTLSLDKEGEMHSLESWVTLRNVRMLN